MDVYTVIDFGVHIAVDPTSTENGFNRTQKELYQVRTLYLLVEGRL